MWIRKLKDQDKQLGKINQFSPPPREGPTREATGTEFIDFRIHDSGRRSVRFLKMETEILSRLLDQKSEHLGLFWVREQSGTLLEL